MATRKTDSGPYIVKCTTPNGRHKLTKECHTWADACEYMRYCLVSGHVDVTVNFS